MHEGFHDHNLDEFEPIQEFPENVKITEHEDESEMYQEDTITQTQFYVMEGIMKKQTGEILTFVEAIRQGLLDLHSQGGQYFDIVSGSRVSLEKAAELGYINANVNEILNTRHGIRHPDTGQDLTLLEAIQIGLYNPDSRQLCDIHTGEVLGLYESRNICPSEIQVKLIKQGILKLPPMSLQHAIEQNRLNTETGEFTGKFSGEVMSLQDALYNEYIQLSDHSPTIAVSLSDAIENGFIDAYSGKFVDRSSGEEFDLRQALSSDNKLLNEKIHEFVNTDTKRRITLLEALPLKAINLRENNFTDLVSRQSLTLRQAFDSHFISKPMTLTEAAEQNIIDHFHRFNDKGTQNRWTLLEAIANHVIDPDVRHIVDPEEQDVINIREALERGLLDPQGKINLNKQQKSIDINSALHEGLLTKRVRHTIFDVKGIRDTKTGLNLSFNEAVEAGALIVPAERLVDLQTNQGTLLSNATDQIIDPMLKEFLTSPTGIKEGSQDLTLIRAVAKGFIDSAKGVIIHRNREMNIGEAYNSGIISLRGALRLAGLFDVHSSLMAPIKKRDNKRRIRRPGQTQDEPLGEDKIKVTLADAMKQGLIDSRTQRFRQGNQEMSLHDALSQGLIDPASEWIIPNRHSQVGPTIEEKTQETVTETGQQLAPKIYPDKQLEESVNTVKRVRRTETSAVGGPGGVSVYRAITGGKNSIEVPADGYHIREAERRGFLDLSSGIVSPPGTDKHISLEEAFTIGVLNPKSLSIRDPKSNRQLSVQEAIEQNVMDRHGYVEYRGRRLTLQEAIDERIAHIDAEPPATTSDANKKVIQFSSGGGPVMSFRPVGQAVIEEHEQSWSYDSSVGQLVDTSTGEKLSLEAALRNGRLSQEDLRVCDALTGREMTFEEAEKWGIIDTRSGYYLDKRTGERLPFTEAARQHRIYPTGGVPENAGEAVHTTMKIQTRSQVSKKEALNAGASHEDFNISKLVSSNRYDASTGRFQHPDSDKDLSLKELMVKGFLNPYATTIVDRRQNREMKLLDAIEAHIVDEDNGTVKDTSTGRDLDFRSAIAQGLVKEHTQDTLENSLVGGRLDPTTGEYVGSDGRIHKFHDAVKRNIVDGNSITVRDPATGEQLGFHEAVNRNIVDPDRGVIRNQRTNETTSFSQGLTSGVLSASGNRPVPSGSSHSPRLVERKLQLTPYAQEPHRPQPSSSSQQDSGVSNFVKNQVAVMERRGTGGDVERLVDLGAGNQVMVKVVRGNDGLEKGEYVDPSTGMKFTIQLHGDPYVTQTTTNVRSTSQVQSVDLEPHAQFVGIDKVKDLRNGRIMTLQDAQRMGLARVDRKGKQNTRSYSVFRSNIQLAVNSGVVDSNGEKISLQDAISQRIVDIQTLKYNHPKMNEPLDLSRAANMGLIDMTLAETLPKGVSHPVNGEKISVQKAIELGKFIYSYF